MSRAPGSVYLGTFLVAGSVLMLEVALTRIYSVLAWHHFTSLVISVASLGFGAAGSYLTVRRRREAGRAALRLDHVALLYAVSLVLCVGAGIHIPFEPLTISTDWSQALYLVLHEILLVVPFFFAGLFLSSTVSGYPADVYRVYFADLTGAGIGALLAVPCISLLGATSTLLLVALLASLAGLMLSPLARGRRMPSPAAGLSAAGFGALFFAGVWWDPFLVYPAASKEMHRLANFEIGSDAIDLSRWHVVARIDVTHPLSSKLFQFGGDLSKSRELPRLDHRWVFQDGAAPTAILRIEKDVESMTFLGQYLQSVPYVVRPGAKVLVIGVGGGIDVLIALHHGARSVTGAEINPVTVEAMTRTYSSFTRNAFNDPRVDIRVAEGRHFVTQTTERYDVIQLSGVDTFSALSSGAYALAENYLYTVEAVEDFWDRLTPDGVLSFSRWVLTPPRETLRLVATMVEAVERRGVGDPHRHLFIVRGRQWAETLLKRSPFTADELRRLRAWAEEKGFTVVYDPDVAGDSPFDTVVRATRSERERFYETYRYQVRPSTDDSPFFFNYYKWSRMFEAGASRGGYITTDFPLSLFTLGLSLALVTLLGVLAILLPLRGDASLDHRGKLRALVYFGALGLGFMFVEIGLIQKLMILLGGPTYSLAITLFAILLFSGLGSYAARAWQLRIDRLFLRLGLAIAVAIPLLGEAVTFFTARGLGLAWGVRVGAALALVAPTAFLMGMAFPVGLRVLHRMAPAWVSWGWATNSVTSVLGPLLGILIGMQFGFRALFGLASIVYLLGFLAFRTHVRATLTEGQGGAPAA